MERDSKKPISITVSVPVLKKLRKETKRLGLSRSAIITDILRGYFEQRSIKNRQ